MKEQFITLTNAVRDSGQKQNPNPWSDCCFVTLINHKGIVIQHKKIKTRLMLKFRHKYPSEKKHQDIKPLISLNNHDPLKPPKLCSVWLNFLDIFNPPRMFLKIDKDVCVGQMTEPKANCLPCCGDDHFKHCHYEFIKIYLFSYIVLPRHHYCFRKGKHVSSVYLLSFLSL